MTTPSSNPPTLVLRAQETPYDHPSSRFLFLKPLVATRAAWDLFGPVIILRHYFFLQQQAKRCQGLDYLQVFEDHTHQGYILWFIEDAEVVTALLPSDY